MNAKNKSERTALHMAASRGYAKVAEVLLSRKEIVMAGDNGGDTPLHDAATGGHPEVIALLLSHGAILRAKDKSGNTPLHLAAQQNQARRCRGSFTDATKRA